jgi:ABC-type thiamine transport system substrate-binding protein
MTLIEKGFEGKYGLKVSIGARMRRVIDRGAHRVACRQTRFDIVIGARGALLLGKEENICEVCSHERGQFSGKFKDADVSSAWRVTPVGVLYNTELVKWPTCQNLDDLLEAKWQAKISMPDPSRHASTAQYLWNQNQIKEKNGWSSSGDWLQKPLLLESYSTVRAPLSGRKSVGSPTFSMPAKPRTHRFCPH